MRKLTVIRKRAFASMFDKTWFYLQDDEHGNESIDCTRCRLICELKNGTSQTVEIAEDKLTLFAVSGDFKGINSEHGFAVDKIVIGEGSADVTVTGKRTLNPMQANPFIFERR